MKRRSLGTPKRLGLRDRLVRWICDSNSNRRESRPSQSLRPRLERLEDRRLLAATDLAAITGLVFNDATGNGFDSGEQVANVALDLYRDDGDMQFEPGGDDDPVFRTSMTGADGRYSFDRLSAGGYFVLQRAQTASGVTLPRSESSLITINSTDVQGRLIRTIDPFNQTSQTVLDDVSGPTPMPVTSVTTAPEVIGGERDLFVNLTSAFGDIELGANKASVPNLFSFDSGGNGSGIRRVTWDGFDGDAASVNDTGFLPADRDLTSAGEAIGIGFRIGADQTGGSVALRIYSDDGVPGTANRFSTGTVNIEDTGGSPTVTEFLPFTLITATSGGGALFSDVGAIELEITGVGKRQRDSRPRGHRRPEVVHAGL